MEPNENELNNNNAQSEISAIESEESIAKIRSAANWFFWIAALSLINSILNMTSGNETTFLAGLGISQIIDGVVKGIFGYYHFIGVVLNILVTGVFVFIGWKARQVNKAAFITGLVLYSLDAALFFVFEDWMGFGFHILVFFFIFRGVREIGNYNALNNTA
jgi:hypothetical protein